jgi:hypothetical protein
MKIKFYFYYFYENRENVRDEPLCPQPSSIETTFKNVRIFIIKKSNRSILIDLFRSHFVYLI